MDFTEKPKVLYSRDIATKYNLPLKQVQVYAKILNIPKDRANIYIYNEETEAKFVRFLEVTKPH